MRALIQRVSRAQASYSTSEQQGPIASIGKGFLVLAGFEEGDSLVVLEQMAHKIRSLRVFSDAAGKMNLPSFEVGAEWLVVSQFTLYADCKYGNRPSFTKAAEKGKAKELFEHFVKVCEKSLRPQAVKHTPFGSDLAVELVNDGPVTLWLDSKELGSVD